MNRYQSHDHNKLHGMRMKFSNNSLIIPSTIIWKLISTLIEWKKKKDITSKNLHAFNNILNKLRVVILTRWIHFIFPGYKYTIKHVKIKYTTHNIRFQQCHSLRTGTPPLWPRPNCQSPALSYRLEFTLSSILEQRRSNYMATVLVVLFWKTVIALKKSRKVSFVKKLPSFT